MEDVQQEQIIRDNPIGEGLDGFHTIFNSICNKAGISCTLDALEQLGQEDMQDLISSLLSMLCLLPVTRLLSSKLGHSILRTDLIRFNSVANSSSYDFDCVKPLLCSVLEHDADDVIWDHIYRLLSDVPSPQHTPPPQCTPSSQPIATVLEQTPWVYTTSGIMNSSEKREEVDRILKQELGPFYVDIPSFHETYFGQVAGLEVRSKAVFEKCVEGSNPLFGPKGWRDWPTVISEKNVVDWFHNLVSKLEAFADDCNVALASTPASIPTPAPTPRRKLLAQPNTLLSGSAGKRSMDIGFVSDDRLTIAAGGLGYSWLHVLVPGELKMDSSDDILSVAWMSIAKYAREVLSAGNTRRFVLGFTLCGSLMRLWEFDRLGGIASKSFDINRDGQRFVSTMLGFLWMSEEELGFDPTFKRTPSGQQFIEINRNGANERLMIDKAITRCQHCIAGRATICWKAYPEEDPRTVLIIKDSWQFPERDVEGDLLRKATDQKVVNIARYYHYEVVQVGGTDDDIRSNVRRGLDVTKASNYKPDWTDCVSRAEATSASRKSRSSSVAGMKRQSSQAAAPLPASKRPASSSRRLSSQAGIFLPPFSPPSSQASSTPRAPSKPPSSSQADAPPPPASRRLSSQDGGTSRPPTKRPFSHTDAPLPPSKRFCPPRRPNATSSTSTPTPPLLNREHRRTIVRDYGLPIYKASSPARLLAALEGCIAGHESLYRAGFLHRDISINNLIINEDASNPSWPSFLIDLDLAIEISRDGASGAKSMTGTRAFIAIGALMGELHSFMHDIESFYWVLFWICIHYEGPGKERIVPEFDKWNYMDTNTLLKVKAGEINSSIFAQTAAQDFTDYYRPLTPLVDKLRQAIFPGGDRWKHEDPGLYARVRNILAEGCTDQDITTPLQDG